MAKVKLSAIVTAIHGKIGGHVFTTGSNGSVLSTKRNFSGTANYNGGKQQNILGQVSHYWSQLPEATQQNWVNYTLRVSKYPQNASLVNPNKERGLVSNQLARARQLFIQWNVIRLSCGLSISEEFDLKAQIIQPISCIPTFVDESIELQFSRPINTSNEFLYISISSPKRASINNSGSSFRNCSYSSSSESLKVIDQSNLSMFPNFFSAVGSSFLNLSVVSKNNPEFYNVFSKYKFTIPN